MPMVATATVVIAVVTAAATAATAVAMAAAKVDKARLATLVAALDTCLVSDSLELGQIRWSS
jgi:hypothetical protein